MSKMLAMDVDQDGNMDKILEMVRRQNIRLYSDCSGNSIHPNTPHGMERRFVLRVWPYQPNTSSTGFSLIWCGSDRDSEHNQYRNDYI